MKSVMAWLRRHPVLVSSGLMVGSTAALAAGLWFMFSAEWAVTPWLIAWLVSITGMTFLTYGFDKFQAVRGGGRVPELTLVLLAILGGTGGAYAAMRLFRHKTVKRSFQFSYWAIVALQVVIVAWIAKANWLD